MKLQFGPTPFSVDIEIWLPSNFPFQAPFVFVQSKKLRVCSLMDETGKVQISYLSYWHTRPNSNLLEMMNYLHQAFCQEPPIFLNQNEPLHNPVSNGQENIVELRNALRDKLQRRLNKLEQDLSVETDRILAQNTLLSKGEEKIKKGISAYNSEILKIEDERDQMVAKKESLKDQIEELKQKGQVDIEKLLLPQSAVSKQ